MSSPDRPPADEPATHAEFLEAFGEAGRALSNATIAFHEAIADRLGLHITDHKALGILLDRGPLPAGQLAEILGLTTGAVTALTDRLERAGYVRRERDPEDRRKVLVAPVRDAARDAEIHSLFEPMTRALARHLPAYDEEQRALLLDFIHRAVAALREATREVRVGAGADRSGA
ncbi:MAG TPA: MarR family transcriptional regulator [Longimicrobiales bacterium]